MSLADELRIKREANVVFHPLERWRQRVEGGASPWFTRLLAYACHAEGKSRPSKTYLAETRAIVDEIGQAVVRQNLLNWLATTDLSPPADSEFGRAAEERIVSAEREILRGVIWAARPIVDDELCARLGDFAVRCFKKIPDHGPASAKLGNAVLLHLGAVPGVAGVAALARVSAQVRYPSAKKQIGRVLDDAATRAGITRDELEELSVPTFGLVDGEKRVDIAGYGATLSLTSDGAALSWTNANGKALRSEPKAAKENGGEQVKAVKREKKELAQTVVAQIARLERLWLRVEPLTVGRLRRRYLEHPLVGHYARGLLWSVGGADSPTCTLFVDGAFVALGEPVAVSDSTPVRLWHPIESQSAERVSIWRDWLAELGITQPFAQIYRDVYRAGETDVDDRFSGHILLQTALRSQCQRRGWSYQLQGHWDGGNNPTLSLPSHEIEVSFDAEPVPHNRDDVSFQYLMSGDVRVDRSVGNSLVPVAPRDIDRVVYSEALRGVSQIVAHCTIAIDEGFDVSGWGAIYNDAWRRGAWGDLAPAARMRADILRNVLPRTVLRDRASVDERWLVVRVGDATHRIHVGSGFVEGQDGEALAVRLKPSTKRAAAEVFLPDEGDAMIRKIIAKALTLAD